MAELSRSFDFTTVELVDNFDPIPAGDYVVEVVDSSVKKTKAGDGEYIALQLRVVEGPYENRRIFTNINTESPKADTQAIGERQLAMLCTAVRLPKPLGNTVELHNVPVIARVSIKEGSNGYPARNNVSAYKPVDSAPAPHVAAASTAPAANQSAPWKR